MRDPFPKKKISRLGRNLIPYRSAGPLGVVVALDCFLPAALSISTCKKGRIAVSTSVSSGNGVVGVVAAEFKQHGATIAGFQRGVDQFR